MEQADTFIRIVGRSQFSRQVFEDFGEFSHFGSHDKTLQTYECAVSTGFSVRETKGPKAVSHRCVALFQNELATCVASCIRARISRSSSRRRSGSWTVLRSSVTRSRSAWIVAKSLGLSDIAKRPKPKRARNGWTFPPQFCYRKVYTSVTGMQAVLNSVTTPNSALLPNVGKAPINHYRGL